jgi:FkbM family methyltransferase
MARSFVTVRTSARQVADGLRRRWQYRDVKATSGTVLREFRLLGIPLLIADFQGSVAVEVVAGEIGYGAYDFSDIRFRRGEVVLDLGAHVGIVSIFLAKTHPDITIHAFEPSPPVFELLEQNLRRNRVKNVIAHNQAVAARAGSIDLVAHLASNSAGSTAFLGTDHPAGHERFRVPSVSLDDILNTYRINRCPLLKIDIEGSEYDVLHASHLLGRVMQIRGEFHENAHLRSHGHTMKSLQVFCESVIGAGNVRYTECVMQDP